jgi:hypothetical protein
MPGAQKWPSNTDTFENDFLKLKQWEFEVTKNFRESLAGISCLQ